jgi:hypothetical protein
MKSALMAAAMMSMTMAAQPFQAPYQPWDHDNRNKARSSTPKDSKTREWRQAKKAAKKSKQRNRK